MFVFFLMIRRPPRSTLFPYDALPIYVPPLGYKVYLVRKASQQQAADLPFRSEEHTSELQSLQHLVCRLLLEKKLDTFKWPRRKGKNRIHRECAGRAEGGTAVLWRLIRVDGRSAIHPSLHVGAFFFNVAPPADSTTFSKTTPFQI